MLKTFKVQSFKSLEDASIDLGIVNVFIGANGSGKSNLLEALGVLGAAANGRVDDEALLRRGVRPGLPVLYKSSFKNSRQPMQIQLTATNSDAIYSVGLFNPLEQPDPAWRFKTEWLEQAGKKIIGRSPASLQRLDPSAGYAALKVVEMEEDASASELLRSLRQFAIYSPDTAALRGLRTDTQSRDPLGLSGGRLADAAETIIRFRSINRKLKDFVAWQQTYQSIIELIDWADSIRFTGPASVPVTKSIAQPNRIVRFRDKYMAEKRNVLSGYDASEGALYVLFMAILCHHPDTPPVFAVDNFDHALNPRLARALTRKICDWVTSHSDRQLLLTSHNPLVLDGLPLRDDRIRLFTVQRSNKGRTIVERVIVDEKLMAAADNGTPLSQQWVMGTFGGVPDL